VAHWSKEVGIGPLRYLLRKIVDRKLAGHVDLRVMPFGEGGVEHQPDSRFAEMYTLLALELAGMDEEPGRLAQA